MGFSLMLINSANLIMKITVEYAFMDKTKKLFHYTQGLPARIVNTSLHSCDQISTHTSSFSGSAIPDPIPSSRASSQRTDITGETCGAGRLTLLEFMISPQLLSEILLVFLHFLSLAVSQTSFLEREFGRMSPYHQAKSCHMATSSISTGENEQMTHLGCSQSYQRIPHYFRISDEAVISNDSLVHYKHQETNDGFILQTSKPMGYETCQ